MMKGFHLSTNSQSKIKLVILDHLFEPKIDN